MGVWAAAEHLTHRRYDKDVSHTILWQLEPNAAFFSRHCAFDPFNGSKAHNDL
ncbi:MAG: hypothetical protein O7D91_04450 [Planctomycetota bacterium]|nr:hypothetical protein [Planctomycetota bacterium]